MAKKKIGILGGTFDPIHYGHLMIAENAREAYELDKVIFMPAGCPPHKDGKRVSPADKRLAMVELAVKDNSYFVVSDYEITKESSSYTVDTMGWLKEKYPEETEFYFILGADELRDLPHWKEPQKLLTLCKMIAVTRPHINFSLRQLAGIFKQPQNIETLGTPEMQLSATDIRNRIKNGVTIRYMVPDAVLEFIKKEGLYLAKD